MRQRNLQSQVTPTITAGAYTTGKALGGLMVFKDFGTSGLSTIQSITVVDKSGSNIAIDIVFFSQTFIATADGSAIAISSADLTNCLGVVKVLASDYSTNLSSGGLGGVATKSQVYLGINSTLDNNAYAQLVARGSGTFVSTSDITVKVAGVLTME